METIKFGHTYIEKYLSNSVNTNVHGAHTRITKVKQTKYGFIIDRFNTYITLWKIKLYINENGSAVAKVTEDRNYCPTQKFNVYFDTDKREIIGESDSDERKYYNKIKN